MTGRKRERGVVRMAIRSDRYAVIYLEKSFMDLVRCQMVVL